MFILSHGRPDRVFTVRTLERAGYTGDWYIVIDNEDKTADEYYRRFGEDRVIMFDKPAIAKTFDTADNFDDRKTIVFARNACFEIADRLGYTHFMELDDDYTSISFRFNRKGEFKNRPLRNLDYVMHRMIEFYDFQSTHPHGVRRNALWRPDRLSTFNPRTRTGCDPSRSRPNSC